MRIYLAFSFFLILSTLTAQLSKPVDLINPSFEGKPSDATMPVGWFMSIPGTTPDILPGYWGVYQEAEDGDTFLGLITRPDGSWEAIAQRLPRRLKEKECYQFLVDLAHSKTYSGYNGPLKLRVYGGSSKGDRSYLLFESPLIDHAHWKSYPIQFNLKRDISYLIFEAYHSSEPFKYPGNILLDNVSRLVACPRA